MKTIDFKALHERALSLSKCYKKVQSELLDVLQEIDATKTFSDYIVAVPATVQPTLIMLRTAYYSRKLNQRFGGKQDEEEI